MDSIFIAPDTETRQLLAEFTVPGEPVSKARARFTKRGSKTVAYTPEKTKVAENAMAAAYLKVAKKFNKDTQAAYAVRAHFYNGTRQRRDVDNMVKLVLDGLNSVAWVDDNQVLEIAARKSFVTKAEARTVVQVYLIGDMEFSSADCHECGKSFRLYESTIDRKFCSLNCVSKSRAKTRMVTCLGCGTEFDGGQQIRKPKYCSMTCKSESMSVDVTCFSCGEAFRRPQSLEKVERHFCSAECRSEAARYCRHGHPWELHLKSRPDGRKYCGECNRLRAANRKNAARGGEPIQPLDA